MASKFIKAAKVSIALEGVELSTHAEGFAEAAGSAFGGFVGGSMTELLNRMAEGRAREVSRIRPTPKPSKGRRS